MYDEIFKEITNRLEALSREYGDYLSEGKVESFADYKYTAGTIQGLREAVREIGDLRDLINKQDMED